MHWLNPNFFTSTQLYCSIYLALNHDAFVSLFTHLLFKSVSTPIQSNLNLKVQENEHKNDRVQEINWNAFNFFFKQKEEKKKRNQRYIYWFCFFGFLEDQREKVILVASETISRELPHMHLTINILLGMLCSRWWSSSSPPAPSLELRSPASWSVWERSWNFFFCLSNRSFRTFPITAAPTIGAVGPLVVPFDHC